MRQYSNVGNKVGGSRFSGGRSGGPARHGGGAFRPRFGRNNNKRRGFGMGIDVSMFVRKASGQVKESPIEIKHTFADFDFGNEVKTNLARKGFNIPTPIQDQTIPAILKGRD